MNDWWNDPPDDDIDWPADGPDYGPEDIDSVDLAPISELPLCPHGNEWGECQACMVAGDLEFDARRERGR